MLCCNNNNNKIAKAKKITQHKTKQTTQQNQAQGKTQTERSTTQKKFVKIL